VSRRIGILLIALTLQAQDQKLDHARTVNLARSANLPDFVADEIAVRYKSRHVTPPQWQLVDRIESQIVVQGSGFTRQNVMVNDKLWNKPNLPDGSTWSVRFGYEIKPLFSPECHTVIEYEGPVDVQGKLALAYRFHSAPDGCFGFFSLKNGFFSALKTADPARRGRFLIDDPGGTLIYFEIEATEFPKGFDADPSKEIETWDYVKIGDATYLLPVSTEMFTGFQRENLWRVTVQYRNHRHFEASTSVTFK
jgi:hypothetical protein